MQHKLIMFKNIKKKIVNLNVICVKKLQNFFSSTMFQTTVSVCTINATITSRQNQTINLTKNETENHIFILFDESMKSERVILINDRVKQYISQIAVTALSVDENSYEKNSKNIFEFIKTLQIFDASSQRNRIEILTAHARKSNVSKFKWTVDVDDFFRYENRLYVFNEKSIRVELLKRHHDDVLTNHFDVIKTTKLFNRKYYWFDITKYVKNYVEICDICQKTKTSRHRSYDVMQFLFMSIRS